VILGDLCFHYKNFAWHAKFLPLCIDIMTLLWQTALQQPRLVSTTSGIEGSYLEGVNPSPTPTYMMDRTMTIQQISIAQRTTRRLAMSGRIAFAASAKGAAAPANPSLAGNWLPYPPIGSGIERYCWQSGRMTM